MVLIGEVAAYGIFLRMCNGSVVKGKDMTGAGADLGILSTYELRSCLRPRVFKNT